MEAAPPLAQPLAPAAPPQRPERGMLERLDHLKCAVCLEFMVAAHSVVPCGARLHMQLRQMFALPCMKFLTEVDWARLHVTLRVVWSLGAAQTGVPCGTRLLVQV